MKSKGKYDRFCPIRTQIMESAKYPFQNRLPPPARLFESTLPQRGFVDEGWQVFGLASFSANAGFLLAVASQSP